MQGFRKRTLAKFAGKFIEKDYFLGELEKQWAPHLGKGTIEEETEMAWKRIEASGQMGLFTFIGITKEDIQKVIERIRHG